jgi:hypothetical protein
MIGYKIAIGINRDYGVFPVLVTLEIPKDAMIVRPIEEFDTTYQIQKLRTDKATVIELKPVEQYVDFAKNWNMKAYSAFLLYHSNFTKEECFGFCYEKGETLISDLCLDKTESCCRGIHFFETVYDAYSFLFFDPCKFIKCTISVFNDSDNNTIRDELMKLIE